MFSTIKLWIAAGFTMLLGVLVGIIKYRGNQIDSLEEDIVVAKQNAETANKVVEQERKTGSFEADNRVAAAKAHARDVKEIEETFYSI